MENDKVLDWVSDTSKIPYDRHHTQIIAPAAFQACIARPAQGFESASGSHCFGLPHYCEEQHLA